MSKRGLQLLAQRAEEGVTFGERQREVDRLDVEADRWFGGDLGAEGERVGGEVDAVALPELHRLVLGPTERRRGPDHRAEGEVPPLPTDVGDVRVGRRLEPDREPPARERCSSPDGEVPARRELGEQRVRDDAEAGEVDDAEREVTVEPDVPAGSASMASMVSAPTARWSLKLPLAFSSSEPATGSRSGS